MNEKATRMLTIKEAGKLIPGLTEFRIRALCIDGELPCIKCGKKYLINEQMIYKYVNCELLRDNIHIENKSAIKRIDL